MKICDLIPSEITDYNFRIRPENIPPAFEAAKVLDDALESMDSLTEIFAHFGLSAKENERGFDELSFSFDIDVDTMDLINLVETLAPYVEAGSFIEMAGSKGGAWRWLFDGEKVIAQFPVDYVWPSQPLNKNCFLGFYQTSRQNYWESTREVCNFADEIIFGIQSKLGGTACELAIRWYELRGELSPRFELFIDSIPPMEAQSLLRIIQSALDYGKKLTPEDFCKCLMWLGFKDMSDKKPG